LTLLTADVVSMPPSQTELSAMLATQNPDKDKPPSGSPEPPPDVDKEKVTIECPELTELRLSPNSQPDAFSVHWSAFEETVIHNDPASTLKRPPVTAEDLPVDRVFQQPAEAFEMAAEVEGESKSKVEAEAKSEVEAEAKLEVEAEAKSEVVGTAADDTKQPQTLPDPTFERLLYCLHYWTGRRQELAGIQNDLHSRIRSQKAEISRIKACIEQLLASGGKQARQVGRCYRNAERLLTSSTPLTGGLCSAEFEYLCPGIGTGSEVPGEVDLEDDDEEEEVEEEEEEEEEDESELASTLAQLMRENKRLEALNTTYVEKIIAQRNSCTDLKELVRLAAVLLFLWSLWKFCTSAMLYALKNHWFSALHGNGAARSPARGSHVLASVHARVRAVIISRQNVFFWRKSTFDAVGSAAFEYLPSNLYAARQLTGSSRDCL
uniref:BEN domain containing 5 n=1 Tax=Schistocephalus solidus TaxID=70667 RepID=A0A183T1A1_SCHSO